MIIVMYSKGILGGSILKNNIKRLFVEKKNEYAVEAHSLLKDLKYNLGISSLKALRVINRYDVSGILDREIELVAKFILSEPSVDSIFKQLELNKKERIFAYEYLPGQYDVRADSAIQCIQLLLGKEQVKVRTAKVVVLSGDISEEEFCRVKEYCINTLDTREAELIMPCSLEEKVHYPQQVERIDGFVNSSRDRLMHLKKKYSLAMSEADLSFVRDYFRGIEKRNPTITELRVIDTYWSDHCRHTTFMTNLEKIQIVESKFNEPVEAAYKAYLNSRHYVYENSEKPVCLMDIATLAMKEMKKQGMVQDLDVSEEINACSIEVEADIEGSKETWLLMFKNETHNHPTEIEPFGGAATCLGGAIRDPLSGRAYVYQAMRVTGSGDPRTKIDHTLPGKLPQRKITIGAAEGYSSYGNQIGLATGQVAEHYDEDFRAKRMEIGAVIGAAPKANVVRERPVPGDVVVLIGGRTGRDGCGGATGSSKVQDENSIVSCGAEVQKGNPVTERKLQRLFRNIEASALIKRCNDFGAGGVAVAIGELAEGLLINLNLIPKKYEGLDGTELAISESQERMAAVVSQEKAEKLISLAEQENLEAVIVAKVTSDKRLKMLWQGSNIVDIERKFLDTNGARQTAEVIVKAPEEEKNYFKDICEKDIDGKSSYKHERECFDNDSTSNRNNIKELWLNELKDLNICSQKGLAERFDSTIGSGTILMPYGGKYQTTASEGMAAKLPVLKGDTSTVSLMTYGYNSKIGKWSPFHGAVYSIVESLAKLTAMGGDYQKARLTLQEYFEKLESKPEKWGKPFAAMLGAFYTQKQFGVPAIGGKDSMSGSFKELAVPPTVVAFAVAATTAERVLSPEFKAVNSKVVLLKAERNEKELPDFDGLKRSFDKVKELNSRGRILSAASIKEGGICEAVSRMCFGNRIGFKFIEKQSFIQLTRPDYGTLILEFNGEEDLDLSLAGINYELLGFTLENEEIQINNEIISLAEAYESNSSSLENVFSTKPESFSKEEALQGETLNICSNKECRISPVIKYARPRIFIPVFPGTNCEYDSQRAFERAGGKVNTMVFRNLSTQNISESIDSMVRYIEEAQIVMLPGGFSAGDEPDGSGKFITAVFRNERIKEAVTRLLKERDGLMLGICNGFQALIKLGLVPNGEIRELTESSPTLTHNSVGRHVSRMVRTKVVSKLSPWFNNSELGEIHTIPISHGEGRFICNETEIKRLIENGQIAAQYVDFEGNASNNIEFNPNGSYFAVEAITSPDGRILGKMAHSERTGKLLYKNIPDIKEQKIFEAGVNYFL